MNRRNLVLFGSAVAMIVGAAQAEEKPNPIGTWKWTVTSNGEKNETTLQLMTLNGQKLEGTIKGPRNEAKEIEDATFKDGEVTFAVTRMPKGKKTIAKYKGKLEGDTLKGTVEVKYGDRAIQRKWEAKLEKSS